MIGRGRAKPKSHLKEFTALNFLDEKRTERLVGNGKTTWSWRVVEVGPRIGNPVGWETDRIVVGKRTAWTYNKLGLWNQTESSSSETTGTNSVWNLLDEKMTEWVSRNHTGGITKGMWWMRNGKNVLAGMCAPFFLFYYYYYYYLFFYFLNLAQKFSVQTIFKIKNIFKKYVCLHLSASFFLG